jgi:hypothetical protein
MKWIGLDITAPGEGSMRSLLTQLIEAPTAEGVITREAPPPILLVPPGRPH